MKINFDFSGRTVLVVGAASGIGRATAVACAEANAKVIALDVNAAELATLQHPQLETMLLNIADSQAVNQVIAQCMKKYGQIDAAILTSAIQKRTPIDQLSDEEWQSHLDVNLSGIFYLLRALFPIMKAQKSGSIVAFTSGLASNGWPGAAAYATTKAGIVGLVKSAAHELRPFGVRINAVSPGLVLTPVFLESASVDELAMYERSLGLSKPEEVVPTLMYLISDAGQTISGNVVERRLIPRVEGFS
ncbi:MAG: SDR family oxidoreductase [Betaproteobacteria bacterium]|jgi:NAD(P)-dependent dehydrogenase (short-subunit alcohol dehydrogenase family)|nr:SDR family NAD(P)-dependent oxidoreductase [Burkholderiales bacterium]NBX91316.1 SDR family oxidoreductase [Betaproteobacteria bacterium]